MRKLVHFVIAAILVLGWGTAAHAQCPSSAPTIDQPANGATRVARGAGNTVTVKWAHNVGAAGTTAYDVFFGPPGTGCGTVRATVGPATRTWSPPASEIVDGATYEWRVVAKGATGCPTIPASQCASFTVANCPTVPPVLTAPANGSFVPPGEVNLQWQNAANAELYEVFVAINNGPATFAGATTATQKTITVEPGRFVGWTVKAAAVGCTGALAQGFSFNTVCPTVPATLQTPANAARFSEGASIPFSWGAVTGAIGYIFEFAPAGTTNWQPLGDQSSARTRVATFAIGSWFWRIRTLFGGSCPELISNTFGFTVSAACSNPAPLLVSPADGSSHTLPVTLAWGATATANSFVVFVTGPNGTQQIGTTTGSSVVVGSLAAGTYQWYVVGKYPNCPDVESARRTIIIRASDCPTATITLTSPANNATVVSPVPLAWTAIAGATAYRVWAAQDGGASVLLANTPNTTATVSLPAGSFKWKVEALRANCPSILSAQGVFTILAATNCGGNTAPQLGTPVIRSETVAGGKTVVLPWIAQSRANLYRVWLAKAGAAAFEDIGVTRGDVTQLEKVLAAGSYRWFVQAFFENCTPLNSNTGTFVVEDTTPRCSTDRPVIIEPVNGSTIDKLRFRITDISTTSRNFRYRFFAILDNTSVAADKIFLGTSTTPEFEPALQLPPGTYTAIVEKSVDECPSTFSDKIRFTIARAQNCNTAAPLLLSPPNNATNVPPDVEFTWSPQGSPAVGTKYVLFVQVNDGTATPVAFTNETRIRHRVPPGRIRWWIVAFPPGCDPVTSQRFAFTVELPQACATNPPVALQPDPVEEISARGVLFAWTRVALATRYHIWLWKEGDAPAEVASTTELKALIRLSAGAYRWFIEAEIPNCAPIQSAVTELKVIEGALCGTPGKPRAHVVGRALSGSEYRVRWSALANVSSWEVQESLSADFTTGETFLVTDTEYVTTKTVPSGATQFHYRVRGLSDCNDERGPFSDPVSIIVIAPRSNDVSVDFGTSGDVTQQIFIPGTETQSNFTITFDKPGLTANPSSGVLTRAGATITLTTRRDQLRLGGNTATVKVSIDTPSSGGALHSHAITVLPFPINVSLVTPVTPGGKSGPPPDALIFSGVGHAPGQNGSFFESDVRLVNLSAQMMKYQLNYTPTGTDGTVTGQTTTVEIAPNQSLALEDVVNTVFGLGETSGALGMLEARPLTSSTSSGVISSISSTAQQLLTLGSSRTYNFTPTGTFGQFVPAVPFAKFVGLGRVLSLQQVAQSAAYRANFGFLEASGQPVDLLVRAYDAAGLLLATIPISLQSSEHKQIGLMLAANGINDLQDGRVEVEVVGGEGKISAYVSEVDNATNDSLLVSGVEKGTVSANRYVVPGMAHKDLGFAFWVSDLRIFNAGSTPVPATLTFYTETNPASFVTRQVTIDPGEIEVLNDVVQNFFGQPNGAGGSVVVTTAANAPLEVTSRTYNRTPNGTYGQFIPGFTVADSVGTGESALHILQVEHSSRFRTNFALNETTGNPVTVEVALTLPDSIVTPIVTYSLAGNEFRQFSVGDFGLPDAVYNGRLTVKAVGGTGKVTAFGSLIDMATNDPTNIPPQR